MKKLTLSLICLFTIAFSQDDINDDMGIKIYVGTSSMSASIDTIDKSNVKRNTGFNIGLMKPIDERITIGGGFTNRGWVEDYEYSIDKYKVSGIELWAKYNLLNIQYDGTSSVIRSNFWAGISFANLIDVKAKYSDGSADYLEISDNDLSLMFGISFRLASKNFLNVGYHKGLAKIEDVLMFNQFFIDYSFGL